jgi:hypothetical protein
MAGVAPRATSGKQVRMSSFDHSCPMGLTPKGEVAASMPAVEILRIARSAFTKNRVPNGKLETGRLRIRGTPVTDYSFGAAQVKLAASLCSPFPEKTATPG